MNEVQVQEKTVRDIFAGREHYVIPRYQREYAWTKDEVGRLLADVWEAFRKDSTRNYYLGTLVVIQKNADWEVIDGQQRLTTLSMLYPLICADLSSPVVTFENRPTATTALTKLYSINGDFCKLTLEDAEKLPPAMLAAAKVLRDFKPAAEAGNESSRTFLEMLDDEFGGMPLREYILSKVKLFRVSMNSDSVDPMAYFEVMNNRGEQLKHHELLKAKLLDALNNNNKAVAQRCGGKSYDELAELFDRVWTACSYMDGNLLDHMHACFVLTEPDKHWWDLQSENVRRGNPEDEKSPPWERQSVIRDFSNFLMHVLRLYVKRYGTEGTDEKKRIPLDERAMLARFEDANVSPDLFLDLLVKTRLDFDRFVVKAKMVNDEVEGWRLKEVVRYAAKKYDARNTYKEQDLQRRVICLQSALQVSNAEQRYKEWVYAILSSSDEVRNDPAKMIALLEDYARARIMNAKESLEKDGVSLFACGLRTPRLLLNVVDYLMWCRDPLNFVFRYYNSIEHHHPQHDDKESERWTQEEIDEIGNLYLTSASDNSSMNNNPSFGKVAQYKNRNGDRLPDYPKRRFMYESTVPEDGGATRPLARDREDDGWTKAKMQALTKDVTDMVNKFLVERAVEQGANMI
jgi:hypothetical protein